MMHFSAVERKGSSWDVSSVVLEARSLILAKQHGARFPQRDTIMSRVFLAKIEQFPIFSFTTSGAETGRG